MSKFLFFLLLPSICSAGQMQTDQEMFFLHHFNKCSGSTANDEFGRSNGVLNNGASYVSSPWGCAVSFDGATAPGAGNEVTLDHIGTPGILGGMHSTTFTFIALLKRRAASTDALQWIVNLCTGNEGVGMLLELQGSDWILNIDYKGSQIDVATPPIPLNVWTVLGVTGSGNNMAGWGYIDGVRQKTAVLTDVPTFTDSGGGFATIGQREDDSFAFSGDIDEVLYSSHTLTPGQMSQIANELLGRAGASNDK